MKTTPALRATPPISIHFPFGKTLDVRCPAPSGLMRVTLLPPKKHSHGIPDAVLAIFALHEGCQAFCQVSLLMPACFKILDNRALLILPE